MRMNENEEKERKKRIEEIEDMLWTHHNVPLVSGLSRNEVRLLQEEVRRLKGWSVKDE